MLDRQLTEFSGRDRLGFMLLGLISVGDRVTRLSAVPRSDGKTALPCALSDFLLGVIAANRSLRAALSSDETTPASAPNERSTFSDLALLR